MRILINNNTQQIKTNVLGENLKETCVKIKVPITKLFNRDVVIDVEIDDGGQSLVFSFQDWLPIEWGVRDGLLFRKFGRISS